MKHVWYAGAIAACTLALCTACAGSSSPSTGTGSTTSTTSTSASAPGTTASTSGAGTATSTAGGGSGSGGSTSSSTSGSGSGGSNNGSGPSTCLVRYLNVSVANGQGTAGSVYVDLVFKNLNNQACTLYGYPGVSFGAGTPVTQVGQPADRNPAVSSTLVTLQPGAKAYAVLQIGDAGNYPAGTCQPANTTYLQVIPPNTSNTIYVAYNSTGCKGNVVTMHVEAVQPGAGPQQ
jgi:hypothetical protein